jgi:hypothetical protein
MHLRDIGAGFGAARLADMLKTQIGGRRIFQALTAEFRAWARQFFGIVTLCNPGRADGAQAFSEVS